MTKTRERDDEIHTTLHNSGKGKSLPPNKKNYELKKIKESRMEKNLPSP
jgi:hypothetical protein